MVVPKRIAILGVILFLLGLAGCGGGGGGGSSDPQTGSVSGAVRSASSYNNTALVAATVIVTPSAAASAASSPFETTTDSAGRFAISDLPLGPAHLRVDPLDDSYLPLDADIEVQAGRTPLAPSVLPKTLTETPALRLLPQSATVALGEVLEFDQDVSPWNATPFYTLEGGIGIVTSNGTFVATKTGTGTVTARLGTLVSKSRITVAGASPNGTLVGVVVDPDGLPVSGATVDYGAEYPTSTQPDGAYLVPHLRAGGYDLSVKRYGYEDAPLSVVVQAGKATVKNVTLRPTNLAGLSISPSSATLGPGDQIHFTVTSGTVSAPSMAWSVQEGDTGGTIDSYGPSVRYTAPATRGTYHVVAASTSDPDQRITATVTVRAGSGSIVVE